jgi:carboxymethylenebutenolidase
MPGLPTPVSAATLRGVPLTVCLPRDPVPAGVVVLHEIWGATPRIGHVTSQLCVAGYAAAAPHLYHRQPDHVITDGNVRRAQQLRHTLSKAQIEHDVISAIGYLTRAGAEKIGILGFSMGATIALWAAANAPIAAAVSFYGGGIRSARWSGIAPGIELAAGVSAPWIGFYGDRDKSIPVEQVEQLRTALTAASAPTEIVRYPHAAHAFALDPAAQEYAPSEAQDAWQRTWRFLAEHLHTS